MRHHIYEALYAVTRVDDDTPRLQHYLVELAGDAIGATEPFRALLPGAVTNAIYEFADAARITNETVGALVDAGLDGLLEHITLYERLAAGGGDDRTPQRAMIAVAMIPDCWEDPELSPEFRALL